MNIENHMAVVTGADIIRERQQEAHGEYLERQIESETEDAANEIRQIIVEDAAKVSPKHLTVPYVNALGRIEEISVADLFIDQISYQSIEEIFQRLMQTEAARELREAIAAKYVDYNAAEIAEARVL